MQWHIYQQSIYIYIDHTCLWVMLKIKKIIFLRQKNSNIYNSQCWTFQWNPLQMLWKGYRWCYLICRYILQSKCGSVYFPFIEEPKTEFYNIVDKWQLPFLYINSFCKTEVIEKWNHHRAYFISNISGTMCHHHQYNE